jgi:hypothetical protein
MHWLELVLTPTIPILEAIDLYTPRTALGVFTIIKMATIVIKQAITQNV